MIACFFTLDIRVFVPVLFIHGSLKSDSLLKTDNTTYRPFESLIAKVNQFKIKSNPWKTFENLLYKLLLLVQKKKKSNFVIFQASSFQRLPLMIVANKIDIRDLAMKTGQSVITTEEGEKLAKVRGGSIQRKWREIWDRILCHHFASRATVLRMSRGWILDILLQCFVIHCSAIFTPWARDDEITKQKFSLYDLKNYVGLRENHENQIVEAFKSQAPGNIFTDRNKFRLQ